LLASLSAFEYDAAALRKSFSRNCSFPVAFSVVTASESAMARVSGTASRGDARGVM
jgi:hypothetical protein